MGGRPPADEAQETMRRRVAVAIVCRSTRRLAGEQRLRARATGNVDDSASYFVTVTIVTVTCQHVTFYVTRARRFSRCPSTRRAEAHEGEPNRSFCGADVCRRRAMASLESGAGRPTAAAGRPLRSNGYLASTVTGRPKCA